MRRLLVFLPLALVAAACGGSSPASSTVAKTASTATTAPEAKPKLHVVLKGQDHHPLVGKKWHYSVTVTNAAGKRVASKIHLQFLFSGMPVGQIGVHKVKNGFWQETFGTPGSPPFPAAARGQPLVIEAIVTAKGYATTKAHWPIVVK